MTRNPPRTAADRAKDRLERERSAVERAKVTVAVKAAAHQEAVKVVRNKQHIVDQRHLEVVDATKAVEAAEKRLAHAQADPDLPSDRGAAQKLSGGAAVAGETA